MKSVIPTQLAGFSVGGDNNGLLFKNNKVLFSLLFSGKFCREDKALMKGDKVVIGDPPIPPTREILTREILTRDAMMHALI